MLPVLSFLLPTSPTTSHINDYNSKRSVNLAAGAFTYKHRSPSRPIAFHPRMTTALAVHDAAFSSLSVAELQGLDGSSASLFPHQEQLTELFSMAMFGGTAVLSLTERHPRKALIPLEEAGLLYRPCNGMCGGRCDTEDCTEICLELWQHKCVCCVYACACDMVPLDLF